MSVKNYGVRSSPGGVVFALREDCLVLGHILSQFSRGNNWIVHDKAPKSFEEVVEIVLRYQCTSKKNHNKPEALGTKQPQFVGKRKTPNEFMDDDCKRQNPFCVFCKKNDHTKE